MNYFSYVLPNYGEAINHSGLPYFWCSIGKIMSDLPSLNISETTLRNAVRKMIGDGLLARVIIKGEKDRAYYRATDLWLQGKSINLIEELKALPESERNKILSSFIKIDKATTNKPNILFNKTDGDDIMSVIYNGLTRLNDEGLLSFKGDIDDNWIANNIISQISSRLALVPWAKKEGDDWSDATYNKANLIIRNMLEWYLYNKKHIKNIKLTINTWIK